MFPFFNNYPGTDLHEIDLAYILKVCSDMVDKVRAQDDKIAAVEQLAQDLKDFVNNYFDNLDVQEEINNKINQMAANGSLLAIIEDPVADVAAEWLANNITPTTPPVDATLTVSGAAADAKVTGDKITEINDVLVEDITDLTGVIEQGFWSFSQGVAGASGEYVRSYRTVNEYKSVSMSPNYGIIIGLLAYDGSTYVGAWNNSTNTWEAAAYKTAFGAIYYDIDAFKKNYPNYDFKITIRYSTSAAITPSDLNGKLSFEKYYEVDNISAATENLFVFPELRNGSDNNAANSYMVSCLYILPYRYSSSCKIIINRPVSANGNKYIVRFDTYNITKGLTQYSISNRVTVDKQVPENPTYIRRGLFDDTSVGFAFSINEVDSNGNNVTLRITDFGENDVAVIYDYAAKTDEISIPSYWQTYIDNKINDIKQLVEESDDVFAFVTDIHVPENQMHSPDLIRYIQSKIDIPNVVNNGDYMDSNTSRRAALDVIDKWVTKTGTDWRVIRGNHDTNYQGNGTVSEKDFSGHTTKRLKNDVTLMAENRNIYYYDNEQAKIRYIFLDTVQEGTVDISDQVNWMKDRITELASGWSVLVITHMYFAPATVASGVTALGVLNVGTQIKAGLDAVYDTASAKIIGYICGHCHRDYSVTTEKGYPIISTTCDAGGAQASNWDINYPTRTVGTTNEQAFDIYGINKSSNTITALRIGAGATSRQFTFA